MANVCAGTYTPLTLRAQLPPDALKQLGRPPTPRVQDAYNFAPAFSCLADMGRLF